MNVANADLYAQMSRKALAAALAKRTVVSSEAWQEETFQDYLIVARNGSNDGERIGCVFDSLLEVTEYWKSYSLQNDDASDFFTLEYHLVEKVDPNRVRKILQLLADLSDFELDILRAKYSL